MDLHKSEEKLHKQMFNLEKERADLIVKLKEHDIVIQAILEEKNEKTVKVKLTFFLI